MQKIEAKLGDRGRILRLWHHPVEIVGEVPKFTVKCSWRGKSGITKRGLFCSYIGRKSEIKQGIGVLLGVGGIMITDNKEKVELLKSYFASMFPVKDNDLSTGNNRAKITHREWKNNISKEIIKEHQVAYDELKSFVLEELYSQVTKKKPWQM